MERTIMDIPEEIRGKIFNYLPDRSITNVREVCLQWRQEVDIWYEHNITLSYDEKNPQKFQELLNYRVHKCSINKLKEPLSTLCPSLPRSTLFKYPHLIRSIKLCTSTISGLNFHQIMQEYGEYLSELDLCLRSEDQQSYDNDIETAEEYCDAKSFFPWTQECNYNLANVKKLSISDHRFHKDNGMVYRFQLDNDIFFNILNNINKSGAKLTSLKVNLQFENLTDDPDSIESDVCIKYSEAILSVMANSSNSLESLRIKSELDLEEFDDYYDQEDGESDEEFNFDSLNVEMDEKKMENLVNLKEISLEFNEDEEYPLSSKRMWQWILKRQKKLEKLTIDGGSAMVGEIMTLGFLKQVVLNTCDTLSKLVIRVVCLEDGTPFDFSIFENCSKLSVLSLRRNNVSTDWVGVNFDRLPNTLTSLVLWNLLISTVEEKQWLVGKGGERPLHYQLVNCGRELFEKYY